MKINDIEYIEVPEIKESSCEGCAFFNKKTRDHLSPCACHPCLAETGGTILVRGDTDQRELRDMRIVALLESALEILKQLQGESK